VCHVVLLSGAIGATEGLDVRKTKLKRIVGQGPVKGSLLNKDLSLHGTMW
jgi:hypothetical protein